MATAGTGGAGLHLEPSMVACAWCVAQGRSRVAVRLPGTRHWYDGSAAFARALKVAGFASHSVCAVCRPAVAAEWGIPAARLSRAPSGGVEPDGAGVRITRAKA